LVTDCDAVSKRARWHLTQHLLEIEKPQRGHNRLLKRKISLFFGDSEGHAADHPHYVFSLVI
jgi:hypothetical protein